MLRLERYILNRRTCIYILVTVIILISSFAYSEKRDVLIIAGDSNYPPYEFVTHDGEYRGFNVDLMRALAIEMEWEIKITPMPWLETHTALNNGEIDAIQGMSFNSQRKNIYDFSTPYILNSSILFVRDENDEIFGYDDLKGKRVAVQRSGAAAYVLADIGYIDVAFFSDLEEAFAKLKDERVDAVLGNKLTGTYILKEMELEDSIKMLGEGINQVDYGVAVKKGNQKLLDEINEGLERLKRNGTYNKIFEKWFGKQDVLAWKEKRYYIYGIITSIIIAFIITGFYTRWNNALKKEVEKRTRELQILNTELESNRQSIKESDTFKQQIIDSLGVGLITFDSKKRITGINKKAGEIFNFKKEDVIGETFERLKLYNFFSSIHIDDCIDYEKSIEIEELVYNKEGSTRYFNYLISPLTAGVFKNGGGVTTFRDKTEETIIRKELIQKDKMHSLGRLVSGIAHEIRNPLTSIKAYLEALPIKYDNPKFREKISLQVPMEINRLDELLKELLEYSKPKNVEKREFTIDIIIEEVLNLLSSLIEDKDIEVSIDIEEGILVYADKQKIKQVLINLFLNSIEALESNGRIAISVYTEMEKTKIKINDNGSGIDEDNINKVFEPFYTTKESGTGLGLLICYQCIKDNGGEIDITSTDKEGTTVLITLNKSLMEGKDE